MSNIGPIVIEFEPKDFFMTIREIRKLISELFEDNNSVNSQIILLSIQNNKIYDNVIKFCILMKSRLNQKLLTGSFKTIDEINREIKKKDLPNHLSQQLKNEKDFIICIFKEEVDESINIINNHCNLMNTKIESLNNIALIQEIKMNILNKESLVANINNKIETLRQESDELKRQIDIIIESEEIIQSKSILNIFSGGLPSIDVISKLHIENNEKEILKTLTDIMKKVVEHIGEGFSYKRMVETRHELINKYLAQLKSISQYESEKRIHIISLSRYYELLNIEDLLNTLITLLKDINEYWSLLIQHLIALKENPSQTKYVLEPHIEFIEKFSSSNI